MDAATNSTATQVENAVDGEPSGERWTNSQTGSVSFPELVRAHFRWERGGPDDGEAERSYQSKLAAFEAREGDLMHAYWSTKRPSAVALTVKPKSRLVSLLSDDDSTIRLHRVTDWLARERQIADLLHHCDTLAIKVSEVLRGTPERIAMQWLYAVQSHLLGFIERTKGRATPGEIRAVVRSQARELIQIEKYYGRAAAQATRIAYFWGMVAGVLVAGSLAAGLAGLLWLTDWFESAHARDTQTFFVCYIAGGLGAVVSVLMRMSSNKFRLDYEVGRSMIARLGSFRPFIGAVFGLALYFLFKSGIPRMQLPDDKATTFFFFGILAFLAGFNERWTKVLFGKAERTLAASLGDAKLVAREAEEDEEEEDEEEVR
jgi:hypothetical protein